MCYTKVDYDISLYHAHAYLFVTTEMVAYVKGILWITVSAVMGANRMLCGEPLRGELCIRFPDLCHSHCQCHRQRNAAAAKAHQRQKLERLGRYITRPAVSTDRLALTNQGYFRYRLNIPCWEGTTHSVLAFLDFIARLAAFSRRTLLTVTMAAGW